MTVVQCEVVSFQLTAMLGRELEDWWVYGDDGFHWRSKRGLTLNNISPYLALGVRRTAGSRERRGCPELRGPLPRIRVTGGRSEREGVESFRITSEFNHVWHSHMCAYPPTSQAAARYSFGAFQYEDENEAAGACIILVMSLIAG